jgi:hypothetical protein
VLTTAVVVSSSRRSCVLDGACVCADTSTAMLRGATPAPSGADPRPARRGACELARSPTTHLQGAERVMSSLDGPCGGRRRRRPRK